MVVLFEGSGLPVRRFCLREGLSVSSFQRWRARYRARPAPAVLPQRAVAPSSFVDLGALGAGRERFELRLDLGGGIVLQLARG